jgi:hypothetical protein
LCERERRERKRKRKKQEEEEEEGREFVSFNHQIRKPPLNLLMKKNLWRSLSMSSSSLSDTNNTHTRGSSDFSNLSTPSVNSSEASYRKKHMSDVIMCCLGLESEDQGNKYALAMLVNDLPFLLD